MTIESQTLLKEYAQKGSEAAFQELVRRYIDLVYSAALRLMDGDTHQAQDVAQIVFADLARLAETIPHEAKLGGWLHRRTCHAAATLLRSKRRRESRERQAAEMNALPDHSEANLARIAPMLDEAINQLSAADRTAILLRFFEHKDFRVVGSVMGSNEDAAQKRVSRALEKLHSFLKREGVSLSAAALALVLAAGAVRAAPAGLSASISSAALASVTAGGGTTLTLIKLMTMSKLQLSIGVAIVAALAIPLVIQQEALEKLREENAAIRQQSIDSARLAAENQQLTSELDAVRAAANQDTQQLAKLRQEVGMLRNNEAASAQTGHSGAVKSGSNGDNKLDAPTVPLLPVSKWANVGNATPEAAWQTVRWALLNNDTNTLAQAIAWDADLKAKAQALFDSSSPSAQQAFGTVDGAFAALMGAMTHGRNIVASGTVSQDISGDSGTLVVQEQKTDGQFVQNTIQMQLVDNGWRVMVPAPMMDAFASFLNTPSQWPSH
jgi:RNA polymerase sigma factor (sigma-70 family)